MQLIPRNMAYLKTCNPVSQFKNLLVLFWKTTMSLTNILNYSGLLLGIFGLILSIYLFIKGREAKEPKCFYTTRRNISKLSNHIDSKIRLFYAETEVSRVFTTRIWLWNDGKKPISKSDIQSKSSILISLNDSNHPPKILDYEIVKVSRPEINFTAISLEEMSLSIHFDFLDKNDGALLEIQHTGSVETFLTAQCVILGVPEGLKPINSKSQTFFFRTLQRIDKFLTGTLKKPFGEILFFLACALLLLGISTAAHYDLKNNPRIYVSTETLNMILRSNLSGDKEENIKNIIDDTVSKSGKSKEMTVMLNYSLAIFSLLFMLLILWRKNVLPYPKNIKPDD